MKHIFYQIKVTGQYACFQQQASISSKNIYATYPSQEIINAFIDVCCNSENIFANLDKDTVNFKVLELELIEN